MSSKDSERDRAVKRWTDRAAQLRAEAAEHRRDAAVKEAEVRSLLELAKAKETAAAIIRPEERADFELTAVQGRTIDRNMNQAQLAQIQKRRQYGRPIESSHPFAQALKTRGITVKEWADSKGLTRSKVKSWMADGDGGRAISEQWAETIRKELGVPRSAWKNGVRS